MPRALYLHVPFCPHVCPYCDFHKMRRNASLVAAYLDRIAEEALQRHARYPTTALATIYFGGGTPSHLSDQELTRIVRALDRAFGFPAELETTLEADPLTFDRARLKRLRSMGFNRLSIGLQSTQDHVLAFLGRRHRSGEGLAAVELALDSGFEVSADLITGVPGQDAALDLYRLARTSVPHISVYTLTIEPHTPFALRGVTVDQDKAADDFELAEKVLASFGLERYEVSNHARSGHESSHNQVYWHGDYFLALGPTAAAFLPAADPTSETGDDGKPIGVRVTNPPIKGWLRQLAAETVAVTPEAYVEDVLMTALRTRKGADLALLTSKTGIAVQKRYANAIGRLTEAGLLELASGRLRATDSGLARLNGVLRALFEGRRRMKVATPPQ